MLTMGATIPLTMACKYVVSAMDLAVFGVDFLVCDEA